MTITPSLFEAYLKCPTKCFLRWLGETSAGNECADFDRDQQASYETEGIKRLTQTLATNACVAGDSIALTGKSAKWRVAIGPVARAGDLESTIEAIEQVPAESQGKQGQLIPIRFIRTNTLTRDDRMLVAFDAFVLSEMRESRPVALPNPLHLAILPARLFPGSSILQAKVLAGHQFSSFECSNRDHMLCLCWFGSRDYGTIGPLSSCYADSAAHVQFSEVQRNDRLTTVRPIVGKFEGIVFT